ncbi:MAG TPA: diacylglycerol kinase family protein [Vicinamibacterales bacterium]|nr:diacylglycerol kinase family protein [Vicinamibacterales bacterium]
MRIVSIINPVSGAGMDAGVASQRVAMIRDGLERRGLRGEILLTERAGHAREMAQRAASERADLVIVWGGDGTVNEVGSGLAGSETVLGLIPAGSGNGLANGLGVPRDPSAALAIALGDRVRRVDVGMLNDQPFFNVAGIGFDAHIARLFNLRARGRRGPLPYVVIGVREGCRYAAREYTVTLEAESRSTTTVKALLIAFANGSEYGLGIQIAPHARLDDGLLEACVVRDRPVLSRFLHAAHLVRGSIDRAPQLLRGSVRRAMVASPTEIEYHLDGEPGVARGPLEIWIRPGALKVRG